jgi:WD40-like Beta Propeller Repeat
VTEHAARFARCRLWSRQEYPSEVRSASHGNESFAAPLRNLALRRESRSGLPPRTDRARIRKRADRFSRSDCLAAQEHAHLLGGLQAVPSHTRRQKLVDRTRNRGQFSMDARRTHVALGPPIGAGPIVIYNLATGAERRIRGKLAMDSLPSPSPDGSRIAFSRRDGIWVAPTAGGAAHRITRGGYCVRWWPDGRTLAYVDGSDSALRLVNNGRSAEKLWT